VWSLRLLMLAATAVLFGCAEKGPILLEAVYQAPVEKQAMGAKASVSLSPFRDIRGKASSVVGKRAIPDGQTDQYVVQGTVAELATTSLKKALAARGMTVTDAPGWDLTVDNMKVQAAPILLGGEIKTLWLESAPNSLLNTHVNVVVQLKIAAGDPIEKKIIRTIGVSSKLEQDMLYSKEKLGAMLSEALSSAIDQVFQDEELMKRFR